MFYTFKKYIYICSMLSVKNLVKSATACLGQDTLVNEAHQDKGKVKVKLKTTPKIKLL